MHHVHSANFSYQNPYYGQIGHHNWNIGHHPLNYNNGVINNNNHGYNQNNNYHFNHTPQIYNQQYGHNLSPYAQNHLHIHHQP